MKRLTLIRHAKSDHSFGLSDIKRPLNPRGEKAAELMGGVLKQQQILFERVFCSPAIRAQQTAERLCNAMGHPKRQIITDDSLYTFDTTPLYRFIESLDEQLSDAAIVGHNPAMTLLTNELCRTANIDNLPTCSVVRIELAIAEWVEVHSGCASLIDFDFPKRH